MWAFGEKGMEVTNGMDLAAVWQYSERLRAVFFRIGRGSDRIISCAISMDFEVSNQDLALIGQFSENKFQRCKLRHYGSVRNRDGQKGSCDFPGYCRRWNSARMRRFSWSGAKLVISCSNKKRGLGDSKYNERRSECEAALRRAAAGDRQSSRWGASRQRQQFEDLQVRHQGSRQSKACAACGL